MFRVLVFLFFVILVFSKCDDNKNNSFSERPYPILGFLDILDVDSSGATFKTDILSIGTEHIINSGFLVSADTIRNDYPYNVTKVNLGWKENQNELFYRTDLFLLPGKNYYVKAFIETEENTILGIPDKFLSLGGKEMLIDSITPKVINTGDTLFIYGKRFATHGSQKEIFLNNLYTPILYNNDSVIKIVVLENITENEMQVKIKISDMEFIFPNSNSILHKRF